LTHVKISEHLKPGVFASISILVATGSGFQIYTPLPTDNIGLRYTWQTKKQTIAMLFTITFAAVGIRILIRIVGASVGTRVE